MDIKQIKMLQDTLSWLNETFISDVGMKPLEDLPQGERSNSKCCVIANALNTNAPPKNGYWSVTNKEIELIYDDGAARWDVPKQVSNFIEMFDEGDFPEYVEQSY